MADYAELINIHDYIYRRSVYYTNQSMSFERSITVKLVLNKDNFNFDLAKSDGSDFRLISSSSGYMALNMWIAYWNSDTCYAVIFFKLVNVGSGSSITLTACWGNTAAVTISDPDSVEILFSEQFSSTPLNNAKWSGRISDIISAYGYRISYGDIASIASPLQGLNDWVIEIGLYADFDENAVNAYTSRSMGVGLSGTENDFDINVLQIDKIISNASAPGGITYSPYTKPFGGLEGYSYNELRVSYIESIDQVTVSLKNRRTFPDIEYTIQREVEGDTRPNNIIIYGRQSDSYNIGGSPVYISWLSLRNGNSFSYSDLDGRDLYIPYETVYHEPQDFKVYSNTICTLQYRHESSFGGNPYTLSDSGYDSDANIWVSNALATNEDTVYVTIHTAWGADLTNRELVHYDSGHTYHYNASRLSDDAAGSTYWKCTTSSGWAAITFESPIIIGTVRVKNTTVSGANASVYEIYGSNYSPVSYIDKAVKLSDGILPQTGEWQSFILTNHNLYRYYIFNVKSTYGELPIELQEWEMMGSIKDSRKKYVSQLRLHPPLNAEYTSMFPKEVSLQGSNDGSEWQTIMPWRKTYTPFVQHLSSNGYWQHYSFYNVTGYWSFRLLCRGNWGNIDGKISIGEWSLNELLSESYTLRILPGTSNNFQQVWATEGCGIDDSHGIIFASNDKFNRLSVNSVISTEDIPEGYTDFNIV